MGPFSEAELQSKLKTNELDSSAYVFSEGMSDWALVSDTAIFTSKTAAPAASSSSEKLGAQPMVTESVSGGGVASSTGPKGKEPIKSAEPTLQKSRAEVQSSMGYTAPKPRSNKVRVVLYSILAVVILISGAFYWIDQGGYVPVLSDMLGSHKIQPPASPMPKPPLATATTQDLTTGVGAPQAKAPRSFDWDELKEFRKTADPKGAPFRIATRTLAEGHPVVVGVLSPLIKVDAVKVMIFPDNEKNMMPISKVWSLKAQAIDGFFAVGPLNVEGAELPAGRYHLMAASNGSFLGEVTFDVGNWPTADKLTAIQAQIQKERSVMADKERSALEMKYREVAAAIDQLKLHSRSATMGAKGAKDWVRLSQPWRSILLKALDDQRSVMSGPMFYPEAQNKLYTLMFETMKVQEALDIFSKGGAKALMASRKKGIGQIWADLEKQQSALSGEIQLLSQAPVGAFKLDSNIIKTQLLSAEPE